MCATVCYMSERGQRARIGVREVRQNLSVYLDRVKEGESLDVTEHNRVVARLIPPEPPDLWDQMVADGRLTPARSRLQDLPPPPPSPPGLATLSELLLAMRDEERW
jgi:prevent-host-death family protein